MDKKENGKKTGNYERYELLKAEEKHESEKHFGQLYTRTQNLYFHILL